ncbi:MAG: carboxypeptidase-like regulatory domain-containing protein [Candidatus Omnitrophica bacterium]|nr:carboxypeptidase-like regulatory domain-containing protein [Candidatus Omnitrophota bacterium]
MKIFKSFFGLLFFLIVLNGMFSSVNAVNTAVSLKGKVWTLPIQMGEEGPIPTPVTSMNVKYNERNELSTITNSTGSFTINLSENLSYSIYILHLEKSGYFPTYTVPTFLETSDHEVMVFTPKQFNDLGIQIQQGKGALMMLTYNVDSHEIITGASAVVKNINGQNVGTIKYISIDLNSNYGVAIKNSPVDAPIENGGTVGFIAYNIDPQAVMVSASKSGYTFNWRPVFVLSNSITSGISKQDSILGKQGSWYTSLTGHLKDEKDNYVSAATITLCGIGISATTRDDGFFTLSNIPYYSMFLLRASKSGYKDTYVGVGVEEIVENLDIPIISNETANQSGINFTNGVIVGEISDINGFSIKNASVSIWTGNSLNTNVNYFDCLGEKIDKALKATSDNGNFVVEFLENVTGKPLYLMAEHKDINGNTYYSSAHNLSAVFPNSITLTDIMINKNIGKVKVSGNPKTINVRKGATNVELFYMKLEMLSGVFSTLDKFILKYQGILPSNIKLYRKYGDIIEEWGSYTYEIDEAKKLITFNIIDFTLYPNRPSEEIVMKGDFGDQQGSFQCSLAKNCDIEATTQAESGNPPPIVFVSIEGAPVEGNTINIMGEIIVNPISLITQEGGGKVSFTVKLATQPTSDVTINIVSGNTSEGIVSPDSLTFTPNNWNIEQTVTVTPVDDNVVDGDKTYLITLTASSADQNYNGKTVNVSVTNRDNDTTGGGGGGCFIATACFGDYNHQVVKILRNFRDKYLITNKIGESFVRWYYLHSPRYAKIIENSSALKFTVRICLYPIAVIAYLILKGTLLPLVLIVSVGLLLWHTR